MNTAVDAAALRRELARRGLSAADIAHRAGISAPTLSRALAGKPIANRSLAALARAVADVPLIAGLDDLLGIIERNGAASSFRPLAAQERTSASGRSPQRR